MLIPNALCCSLYKNIYICAVTNFLPTKRCCQILQVNNCSNAHAQAQLQFPDDQQRALKLATFPIWDKRANRKNKMSNFLKSYDRSYRITPGHTIIQQLSMWNQSSQGPQYNMQSRHQQRMPQYYTNSINDQKIIARVIIHSSLGRFHSNRSFLFRTEK